MFGTFVAAWIHNFHKKVSAGRMNTEKKEHLANRPMAIRVLDLTQTYSMRLYL